ncbi:uncharacterized protein [Rutidosis leptorrhynchoides]|uniref:uncharacterized protein isoform X3 n=1 Tax=Rutidosis leptorrhynchoides TaxID=125765 RepID=UPI003A99DB7E
MSGGFFRGTTADQDTRFSNKHAKLLKSQKFPPELENLVDMTKVKMDVMRPWIAHRVTELLGFEDEVLINFIYGLLEEKVVNGKEIQISLTGFMEKNTGKFMKELWTHLLSAQQNASGVPQQFLDAKEEETRKKQEDTDRITRELKRKKENEGREYEQERVKMDREADAMKANLEPHSRRPTKFSSKWSADDKGTDEKNGSKEIARNYRSPHSADRSPLPPRRGALQRSVSKSMSNSRSPSRSRSLSASPKPTKRSLSSERREHSTRRSSTPRRLDKRIRSPPKRSVSRTRVRSPSPARRSLRSPVRRKSRSPVRRRSRSPIRRRSRSPVRRRSRSPIRRRSRSPIWRRSRTPIRRRSRTPVRRRSRTPVRRRSRTPVRRRSRTPIRRRSRTPIRRSRTPVRRISRSPIRRSRTPIRKRARSPLRYRSPSPFQRRPRSPYRPRSQSLSRSPSPVRGRSPSPVRQRNQRAPSTPRHQSLSPVRRKPSDFGPRRSPSSPSRSSSHSEQVSTSPAREKMGSLKQQHRSPVDSSRDGHRSVQRSGLDWKPTQKETAERSTVSLRSLERDSMGRRISHNGESALSPPPGNSPSRSVSPPSARRSPSEARRRQRGSMNAKDHGEVEERSLSRSKEEKRENKEPVHDKSKHSPQVQKKSRIDEAKRDYPELSEKSLHRHKDILPIESLQDPDKGYKADEMNQEGVKLPKPLQKGEKRHRSGSPDSASEESDHKRKHKRSKRKDVTSDDDVSHDSATDDRKEAKRRRKEERRLKKEEKRKRREERRRKKDSRRSEKLKLKTGKNVDPSSDSEEALLDQKKLEIELREKALESLRAKKGVGH